MATVAGAHSDRVRNARDLHAHKGRREQGRFLFEGPTLLGEALRSGAQILELYVTKPAYEREAAVREAEASGTSVFFVDDRTVEKMSDVETPTGIVGVAPTRFAPLEDVVRSKQSLALADLNDPGNAGTLLRSAEAFNVQAVAFGGSGVDPYHPKVVRAAMGALFRLPLCIATAAEFAHAAASAGVDVLGLHMEGDDIRAVRPAERTALVVGHERRGLGEWAGACSRLVAIPMNRTSESLNAAIAGSIALYALSLPS